MNKTGPNHKLQLLILLQLFLSWPIAAHGGDHSLHFEGKAYDIESGELLYTEHHHIAQDDLGNYLSSKVEYKNPENEIIAKKSVDFTQGQFAPDINFFDTRTGLSKQLQNEDDRLHRIHSYYDKEMQRDSIKKPDQNTSSNRKIVVDAGFDRFIIHHWNDLLEGKQLKFDIFPLNEGDPITFTIKKHKQKNNLVQFRLKPNNLIFALLVDPIKLTYDTNHKRLARYKGLTNIPAERDGKVQEEHFEARIEYFY